MIDRPHSGRGPKPIWCVDGHFRVKNDNARRDLWSTEALFDATYRIGNADPTSEFTGRQRTGDCDVRPRFPLIPWGKAQAARTSHPIGVKLRFSEDVFGKAQRHPFRAIHRATPS